MEGKDFDKLFKDRLGENNVPFDPSNWDRMSAYLDENPIKRPVAIWDYITAATLLIIVLGISIFYYVKIQSQIHEDSVPREIVDVAVSDESSIKDISISDSEILALDGKTLKPNDPKLTDLQNSNQSNISIINPDDYSLLQSESNDVTDVEEVDVFGSDDENYPKSRKKNLPKISDKSKQTKVSSSILFEEEHGFETPGTFDNEIVSNENDTRNDLIEEVEPILNIFPEQINSSFESVDLSINSNKNKWYNINKKPKPFLDAFLGTGFMAKPDYLLIKGGVSIGLDLNPNLFVRTGITFASQNTPRHAGYSYEKTVYSFGSDQDVYELEVQRTNSMSIPLEVGFRKNKNVIFAGVELERILASKGEFHLNVAGDDRILKEKGWIGNKAFLPEPTWNFILGYEYYIGHKTIIGARIESAMSNYINSNEVEEFRSPGASNWGRAIIQIRQKF